MPDGGVVTDPPPPDCNTNADCPDGGVGWVCTINKKCGKIKGPCTLQSDCQADTYCCGANPPCRADMVDMGVCVPANVPPGAPCKGALKAGIFSPALQCEWPAMSLGANDYPKLLENSSAVGTPIAWKLESDFDRVLGDFGLAEVAGFEPDRLLQDATARYWRRFDATMRGLIYFGLNNELFRKGRSGNVLGRL